MDWLRGGSPTITIRQRYLAVAIAALIVLTAVVAAFYCRRYTEERSTVARVEYELTYEFDVLVSWIGSSIYGSTDDSLQIEYRYEEAQWAEQCLTDLPWCIRELHAIYGYSGEEDLMFRELENALAITSHVFHEFVMWPLWHNITDDAPLFMDADTIDSFTDVVLLLDDIWMNASEFKVSLWNVAALEQDAKHIATIMGDLDASG